MYWERFVPYLDFGEFSILVSVLVLCQALAAKGIHVNDLFALHYDL